MKEKKKRIKNRKGTHNLKLSQQKLNTLHDFFKIIYEINLTMSPRPFFLFPTLITLSTIVQSEVRSL